MNFSIKFSYTHAIFDMSRLVKLNCFAIAEKNGRNCDGEGGSALMLKICQKALDQPRHVEKNTCKKNSMLKSNYVEAGRKQPG